MVAGLVASMVVPKLMPGVSAIYAFPAILAASLAGCVGGTLATPPDDDEVLEQFYLKTRPWGFWGPVHERLARKHPGLEPNRGFGRDATNVVVGVVWQTALVASEILLVLQEYAAFAAAVATVLVTSAVLKVNWFDKLQDYPADLAAAPSGRRAEASPERPAAALDAPRPAPGRPAPAGAPSRA